MQMRHYDPTGTLRMPLVGENFAVIGVLKGILIRPNHQLYAPLVSCSLRKPIPLTKAQEEIWSTGEPNRIFIEGD